MANEDNHEVLTRYLLGDLPEQERESFEERYFVDDAVWQALNAAEHDLIDQYVRGSLAQPQRDQFESYYLESPRNREKLEFARTLLSSELRTEAIVASPAARSRWWELPGFFGGSWRPALRMTLAAAAVAAAVAVLFLVFQHQKRQQEEANHKAAPGSGTEVAHSAPTPVPTNPEDTNAHIARELSSVAVTLTPGMVRDASGNNHVHRLMITDATESVLLHLEMEEDAYPRYDAEVRTAEGKVIKHLDGLKGRTVRNNGHTVAVKLPAQSLAKGDYIVKLTGRTASGGAEDVDSYTFSVIR